MLRSKQFINLLSKMLRKKLSITATLILIVSLGAVGCEVEPEAEREIKIEKLYLDLKGKPQQAVWKEYQVTYKFGEPELKLTNKRIIKYKYDKRGK